MRIQFLKGGGFDLVLKSNTGGASQGQLQKTKWLNKGLHNRAIKICYGVKVNLKGQMHHHDDLGSKCAYTCHLSNKTTRKSVLSTPQIWQEPQVWKWKKEADIIRAGHILSNPFWLVERYQWQEVTSTNISRPIRSGSPGKVHLPFKGSIYCCHYLLILYVISSTLICLTLSALDWLGLL